MTEANVCSYCGAPLVLDPDGRCHYCHGVVHAPTPGAPNPSGATSAPGWADNGPDPLADPASTLAFQQAARKTRRIGLLVTVGIAVFVLLVVGLPILFGA